MKQITERKGGLLAMVGNWLSRLRSWVTTKLFPMARENPQTAALVVAGGTVGLLLYAGSAMIINGVVAGMMIAAAFGILAWKAATSRFKIVKQAYNLSVSWPLLTDAGITFVAFASAPVGLTAWIASSVCCLLSSVWLLSAHPVEIEDQEEKPALAEVLAVA